MNIQEIRVTNLHGITDIKGNEILYEIKNSLQINSIDSVKTAKIYRFEGISEQEASVLAEKLLSETIFQKFSLNKPVLSRCDYMLEVAYQPGVMNPEAASLLKSAADLGINTLKAVDSSMEYCLSGRNINTEDIDLITRRLLVNETVERVVKEKPKTLIIGGAPGETEIIPLCSMNDEEMKSLSKDRLFLNLDEMEIIKKHFTKLGKNPTDCELETIAQTWSEHCVHKTFKAKLIVDGIEKPSLMKRLQDSTSQADHPLVLSAYVDNSGVMELYDGFALCGKVETHNSPSAIEPYGGAMTGSGGAFRDIIGTGQGAKVIASTDMFCFAPPDLPYSEVPRGCLHPHYLLRRVVAGVRDYGNRMGVPTNNGSIHFHQDFKAKPSVIVGAYGITEKEKCKKREPRTGDYAVIFGGRTGRDGIHGATFSSGEMTNRTISVNSSAVQIGNPIEEKRMCDALLAAKDSGIIQAITDCGAGGFSSALGEMGQKVGVEVWLDRVPLKYPGLAPWEIWQSESQERMAAAIHPENIKQIMDICKEHNVEATVIGEFTGNNRLEVYYEKQKVCDLDMEFLHNGLPQRVMYASWKPQNIDKQHADRNLDYEEIFIEILKNLNVCSKEPVVRLYDHGVQGNNVLEPFVGENSEGPSDAAVITPVPGKSYGVVISHGLNPVLNKLNPYYGSSWAAAEAVSNAIAVGSNPADLCLIDNFIWPFPDEESLGALDMAVDACTDFVKATGMPFISGKDSLSSTYRSDSGDIIKIPPVLCVSAFGRIDSVNKTVSADFKQIGSHIISIGYNDTNQMGGSIYNDVLCAVDNNIPRVQPDKMYDVFKVLHKAISESKILACHDISEGGAAVTLAEMCFGGNMGADIIIPREEHPEHFLFNETPGCFLVEIPAYLKPSDLFTGIPFVHLGNTSVDKTIRVNQDNKDLFKVNLEELKTAWQKPMREVFGG
ncbi:MAG: phosphoribosylformylglycinamidine synthase subunit PurL [Clostridiales bacterium]|nr:phosphoribosylformylglycinamidine synthase subunit PurL [Clostridiales bacterium]MCF8021916.1 phosphoribosylformylglycinamidine synthase subunit PurL [Clostridiales bacterium]